MGAWGGLGRKEGELGQLCGAVTSESSQLKPEEVLSVCLVTSSLVKCCRQAKPDSHHSDTLAGHRQGDGRSETGQRTKCTEAEKAEEHLRVASWVSYSEGNAVLCFLRAGLVTPGAAGAKDSALPGHQPCHPSQAHARRHLRRGHGAPSLTWSIFS